MPKLNVNRLPSPTIGQPIAMGKSTLAERAIWARENAGLTPAEAARQIGISQPSLSDIETGETKSLRGKTLVGMVKAYGVSPQWLESNIGPRDADTSAERSEGGTVPVVGTVQAGNDGYWEELQYPTGHGDGFVRYPTKDPNAYALRVKGDSMRPRIKPGEFILVEPAAAILAGEEVIVTTTDGRSMVKVLGPRRNGMTELQSINEDHRPIT